MSENEIKMSSYLDVNSVIEDCKKVSICDVVNEAILNSIQANATDIKVKFTTTKKENDLFKSIKSIEIVDNGEGFNDKNIQHFSTLYTKNKQEKGCKGYGRVYYKKAFEIVEICSFNSDKNNEKVDFVFTNDDFTKTDNIRLHTHTHEDNETSLLLENLLVDNINDKDYLYNKANIYSNIFNVIYPYIFLQENKNITISFYVNGNKEYEDKKNKKGENVPLIINLDKIKDIDNEPIVLDKQNSLFFDSKQEINLWYKITKRDFEKNKATITTAICHNNRPLFESSFDKQPLQIDINLVGYDVLFLLESDWIDNQPIDKDHHIKLDDKNKKDKWNDIKKKVEDAINEILCNNIADLKEYNKENKKKFIKKYPEYAGFACEEKETGYFDESKILKQARKYRDELEDKVANDRGSKKEQQKNLNTIMGLHLLSYIRDRQKVINYLKQLLTDKPKLEKALHNLIIKKGLDGDEYAPLSLDDNNIWLLDDKFMTYNYISSDKTIKDIIDNANIQYNADDLAKQISTDDKPDIAIYKNDIKGQKMVFVELKKIKAKKYDYAKGLDQLNNYASYIAEQGIREIYCYLFVANFDEVRRILNNRGCVKIFSHDDGEIWQNTLTTSDKDGNDLKIPAYLQVVSIDAVVNDADKRNSILLKASEEYEKQIDEQYKDDDNSNK